MAHFSRKYLESQLEDPSDGRGLQSGEWCMVFGCTAHAGPEVPVGRKRRILLLTSGLTAVALERGYDADVQVFWPVNILTCAVSRVFSILCSVHVFLLALYFQFGAHRVGLDSCCAKLFLKRSFEVADHKTSDFLPPYTALLPMCTGFMRY